MDWRNPITALFPGLDGNVLDHLWRVNEPRTASQVHRAARVGSLSGIRRALERLTRQGVVTARGAGNVILHELNRDHLAYPAIDAALSAYEPFQELSRRLADLGQTHSAELHRTPTIAIYGSVARGDAAPESDLDLLLVIDDDMPETVADELEAQLRRMGERWTGNRVHVFRCTPDWIVRARSMKDPLLRSWAADARTVLGRPVPDLLRDAS